MAIWQYDFIVAPRQELISAFGFVPRALTREQIRSFRPWRVYQPIDNYAFYFEKWAPELKSWHNQFRMWGNEDSNRIDLRRGDKIDSIEFRVEIRSISVRFIEVMVDFVRRCESVLISAHSLDIIEPYRKNVLLHLSKSIGANRVWDELSGKGPIDVKSFKPTVFLSHSSYDKDFVGKLALDLKEKDIGVWYDSWEIKVGDSLIEKIQDGIDNSGWLAVVLSRNSVSSAWVKKELNIANARELRNRDVFVLPIVIDDCEIPSFLSDKKYLDFRLSYGDGLKNLLDRLLDGSR